MIQRLTFKLNQLDTNFIQAMATTMYKEEARQINNPELLTDQEIADLYMAYMGYPQ